MQRERVRKTEGDSERNGVEVYSYLTEKYENKICGDKEVDKQSERHVDRKVGREIIR
jgi:hypothetical protein